MATVVESKERRRSEGVRACGSELVDGNAVHVEDIGEETGQGSDDEHMLTAVDPGEWAVDVDQDAGVALVESGEYLDWQVAIASWAVGGVRCAFIRSIASSKDTHLRRCWSGLIAHGPTMSCSRRVAKRLLLRHWSMHPLGMGMGIGLGVWMVEMLGSWVKKRWSRDRQTTTMEWAWDGCRVCPMSSLMSHSTIVTMAENHRGTFCSVGREGGRKVSE